MTHGQGKQSSPNRLTREEVDDFLRANASGMRAAELSFHTGWSPTYVRKRCNELGLVWIIPEQHILKYRPTSEEDFEPEPLPEDAKLPGLPTSLERIEALQARVNAGQELFAECDRPPVRVAWGEWD